MRGRCRSTNLCAYCARLSAVENSEVLALDAMTTGGPAIYAVLTTRSACRTPAIFYESRRQVMRALKRRWPDVHYAAQVEFTTGRAESARGARRPHWNLMLKGIPGCDVEAAGAVIRRVWCDRVDAVPAAQYVGLIEHHGGLMRYLALHFQKESQAPPHGWRGHRFLHSRGYFPEGIATVRDQAREQLRYRREVHRIEQEVQALDVALDAEEIDALAAAAHAEKSGQKWQLVRMFELSSNPKPARPPFVAYREVAREGVRRCLEESAPVDGPERRPATAAGR